MRIRPGIELANFTDVGCQREANEDYYCYCEPQNDEEFQRLGRVAIVADGMGGHAGGQLASRMAVEIVRDAYLGSDLRPPEAALLEGFCLAHDSIRALAAANPQLEGMGTTCTAAVIRDGQLHFTHIGDSRLYLLRAGAITCVTTDHSLPGNLLGRGLITAEEARNHPQRHVLTAALGVGDFSAEVSQAPVPLQLGDIIALCTDGLSGVVSEQELLQALHQHAPAEAGRLLLKMVLSRGGPDNITLQVMRTNGASSDTQMRRTTRPVGVLP